MSSWEQPLNGMSQEERRQLYAKLDRERAEQLSPVMPLFTDEEKRQGMCLKVVKPPHGNPDGVHLEFYGRITIAAMQDLRLDPIDHHMIREPIYSAADMLQSLEILFRRWAQQSTTDKSG